MFRAPKLNLSGHMVLCKDPRAREPAGSRRLVWLWLSPSHSECSEAAPLSSLDPSPCLPTLGTAVEVQKALGVRVRMMGLLGKFPLKGPIV